MKFKHVYVLQAYMYMYMLLAYIYILYTNTFLIYFGTFWVHVCYMFAISLLYLCYMMAINFYPAPVPKAADVFGSGLAAPVLGVPTFAAWFPKWQLTGNKQSANNRQTIYKP